MKKRVVLETLKDKIIYRIIPGFALIVSLVSIILPSWFRPLGNPTVQYPVIFQMVHVISATFFLLIIVFPGNPVFYTILGLLFSIYLPVEKADVLYSFVYYCVFIVSIYVLGFFKTKRKVKVLTICVFYFLIIILQLVLHGIDFFLGNLFQYLVTFSLIVVAAVFFFSIHNISKNISVDDNSGLKENVQEFGRKFLDLSGFEDLSYREIIIICKILQNEKYDYIARQLGLSEITVKKAAGNIFRKMDCTDKFDFFGKYSNLAVCDGARIFMTEKREETELLLEMISREKK
ncbi:MAG: LuxR C-terminal-related transcriptional regulator [Treponema sp.]|nr:LuxR C-terminal-related transcriptional regulator [Treponema sp.]